MSWLRVGDTFATDPRVLELGSLRDERLLNEVVGFVVRCAAQSAGHKQDAFVSDATAALIGGSRAALLAKRAHRAGIFLERTARAGQPGWQLLVAPELLHIRLQAEVDWEAKHRALLRDPDVYLPVRLRDGDGCRYCARVVIWKDGKSARGGTLDHVIPDGEDLVVACKGCNSKKQARSLDEAGMTLLPVPTEPHYSAHTRSVFERYGITDPRPGSHPDPAALLDPRPGSQPDPASPRPATQADPAPRDPATPDPAPSTTKHRPATDEPHAAQPDQNLPGRVGSGSDLARVTPAPQVTRPRDGPRRGTRGRRGRTTPQPADQPQTR